MSLDSVRRALASVLQDTAQGRIKDQDELAVRLAATIGLGFAEYVGAEPADPPLDDPKVRLRRTLNRTLTEVVKQLETIEAETRPR